MAASAPWRTSPQREAAASRAVAAVSGWGLQGVEGEGVLQLLERGPQGLLVGVGGAGRRPGRGPPRRRGRPRWWPRPPGRPRRSRRRRRLRRASGRVALGDRGGRGAGALVGGVVAAGGDQGHAHDQQHQHDRGDRRQRGQPATGRASRQGGDRGHLGSRRPVSGGGRGRTGRRGLGLCVGVVGTVVGIVAATARARARIPSRTSGAGTGGASAMASAAARSSASRARRPGVAGHPAALLGGGLAVEDGVHGQLVGVGGGLGGGIGRGHGWRVGRSGEGVWFPVRWRATAARPRAIRERTVPGGRSRISAISA